MGSNKEGEKTVDENSSLFTERLNLPLTEKLNDELVELSKEFGLTRSELGRSLLKIGVRLVRLSRKPGGGVYTRESESEEPEKIFFVL